MKSIKVFLISSLFLLLGTGFLHPISAITQDLGRHLLTGEIIWETKTVPFTNLYSYTYPDFPFINHHWLSEVIFYLIHSLAGFNGLLILAILIVALAFFLVLYFCLKQRSNVVIASIASVVYIGILFERTDVRPELFSFLFLSLFITILYKNRQRFTKWIFLLPLLELLWVNMHIYFIVGILVLLFFLFDITISEKNIFSKKSKGIIIVLLFSCIATVINPNGIQGALYPLTVFQNYGYSIEENQNIFFLWNYSHKPTIIFFAIATVTLFSILLINLKKTKPVDWLLAIFFTILSVTAIRNFPLFVFTTFIPFTENLSILLSKVRPSPKVTPYRKVTPLIIFAIIFWQILSTSSTKTIGFGVEKGVESAADFFITQNIKGPIFNNFDIGSYLESRLYPKEKVFIDGRPEAYPLSFFKETYIPIQENPHLFEKASTYYRFNTIFFAHTDQTPWADLFLRQIITNQDWVLIYLDDYASILVKNNLSNKKLIDTFLVKQSFFDITFLQKKSTKELLSYANFFSKAQWKSQEKLVYTIILSRSPNFCPGLYSLAILLHEEGSSLASVFLNRFHRNCK